MGLGLFTLLSLCKGMNLQYWAVLKNRLLEEGAGELLTKCKQLKMWAADGMDDRERVPVRILR